MPAFGNGSVCGMIGLAETRMTHRRAPVASDDDIKNAFGHLNEYPSFLEQYKSFYQMHGKALEEFLFLKGFLYSRLNFIDLIKSLNITNR